MKERNGIRWMVMMAAGALLAINIGYLAMGTSCPHWELSDFDIRYGEVMCLRQGIDPYDVWSGKVQSDAFVRYDDASVRTDRHRQRVNCYTPWEYSFLLPFTVLPERWACWLFQALGLMGLGGLFAVLFRKLAGISEAAREWVWAGIGFLMLFGHVPAVATGYANYGVWFAVALGGLVWALDSKRDGVAGICLAFLAMKPQIGALVAVPILLSARWRTCLVAGAVCLAGSVWPWIACGKDPVRIVLEAYASGQYYLGISGHLINPFAVAAAVTRMVGPVGGLALVAAITALVAYLALRVLKPSVGWAVRLTPAVLLTSIWTYTFPHDRVIFWLPLWVLVQQFLSERISERRQLMTLVCLLAVPAVACLRVVPALIVARAPTLGGIDWQMVLNGFEMLVVGFVILAGILAGTPCLPRRE